MIIARTHYASEASAALFAANLRFLWPYDLRDICMHYAWTDRYTFSQAFNESFNDLRSWPLLTDAGHILPWSPSLSLEGDLVQCTSTQCCLEGGAGQDFYEIRHDNERDSLTGGLKFRPWATMHLDESARLYGCSSAIETDVPGAQLLPNCSWDIDDPQWQVS